MRKAIFVEKHEGNRLVGIAKKCSKITILNVEEKSRSVWA
jgi:hypothetical protein